MKKLYAFLITSSLFLSASAQLVYKDVAGIFYNRCTSCHHANGGAPFSMMNYSETSPWSASIQNDLNIGKMPPWPPDTAYTRFLHERIITATEKSAILSWISTGSQMGDTTLAPAPPTYTKYHLYGTPDLIVKVPGFASNASAQDAYNCFAIPTGLTQDRYLRAFEMVPNNPNLVHHIVANVDTTGAIVSDVSGGCFSEPGQFSIGGFAPGTPPSVFSGAAPLKIGIRIKAGSKIIMQQHYPAGSAGQIDSTEIRMYFYPVSATGIRPIYVNTFLTNWLMSIPANTVKTYTAKYPSGTTTLPYALSIYATSPHAHKINTSMVVYAYRATPVDTIPLCRIPNWDFDWQGFYNHPFMVKVPAGYKLGSKHVYDNTTNNPNNPNNPPVSVSAGTSTSDEMLFDAFQWMPYQAGDDTIDIGNLLNNDPLFDPLTGIGSAETAPATISSYVFPNPANQSATLILLNAPVASCELKFFDVFGKEVAMDVTRTADAFVIRRTNQPDGVYFYSVHSGNFSGGGKIIWTTGK